MSATINTSATTTLIDLPAGTVCRVDGVSLDAEQCARMAGLGLSIGRHVVVVRAGEPLVVKVYGSRIGLARELARHIHVTAEPATGGA